jgi:hypothetical protein
MPSGKKTTSGKTPTKYFLTRAPKLCYNFGANNPTASRVIKLKNNPALGRVTKNMLGGFSRPMPE